jgi:hypothetical protein
LKTLWTFRAVYGVKKYSSSLCKACFFIVFAFLAGLSALPPMPAGAATNVPYLDAAGEPQIAPAAADLTSTGYRVLAPGWYLASGALGCGYIEARGGDVHLILGDGADMSAESIVMSKGSSLTLYAQSTSESEGKLSVDPKGARGLFTIGGPGDLTINGGTVHAVSGSLSDMNISIGSHRESGAITINGGTVHAVVSPSRGGIGIGAIEGGGTVTINGGTVNATGGAFMRNGVGIGSYYKSGTITINGGTVNATGGGSMGHGVGIGNLEGGGGAIIINGGTVNAVGSFGIGALKRDGTITINDGMVTALGGGGDGISDGAVTINGGTVNATATSGGRNYRGGAGISGAITIKGGMVTATGGSDLRGGGAGIGGGQGSAGGVITISGGTVTATGGNSGFHYGNYGIMTAGGGGAGIGGGGGEGASGASGAITITGDARVTARGGDAAWGGGGAGIGSGGAVGSAGEATTIVIDPTAVVNATGGKGKDGNPEYRGADIGYGGTTTGGGAGGGGEGEGERRGRGGGGCSTGTVSGLCALAAAILIGLAGRKQNAGK